LYTPLIRPIVQVPCTIENPATLRAIQAGTSVTLRITVEPDGQVSNAFVMNTSGDGGVDSLMQCLLVEDQTFKFNPAQSDGRITAANADLTIAVTAN
ncbi:MAG: energy transducer TonB, partial [Leptolyngbya sp. SIO4C5]|nr:energy transducer TonB [Leptolyngbya sp. SIO4C5]